MSGETGDEYRLACERAWEIGIAPQPWKFDGASHVELKEAARMHDAWKRTGQPQHETIVLNNAPCDVDPLDCDYVIDRFLPPGSTLTVHAPGGFMKVYRGRDATQ